MSRYSPKCAVEIFFTVWVALLLLGIGLRASELRAAEPRPAPLTVVITPEEFKALRREVAELRTEVERLKLKPFGVTSTLEYRPLKDDMPTSWVCEKDVCGVRYHFEDIPLSALPPTPFPVYDGCNTCNGNLCTLLSCTDWPPKTWNIQEKTR